MLERRKQLECDKQKYSEVVKRLLDRNVIKSMSQNSFLLFLVFYSISARQVYESDVLPQASRT
jgi:hypothetical protein